MQVYRGRRKHTGQTVAIKVISKLGKTAVEQKALRKELEILRTLKHENIIRWLDDVETQEHFMVITEFAQGALSFAPPTYLRPAGSSAHPHTSGIPAHKVHGYTGWWQGAIEQHISPCEIERTMHIQSIYVASAQKLAHHYRSRQVLSSWCQALWVSTGAAI